jgi:hypothetical protein
MAEDIQPKKSSNWAKKILFGLLIFIVLMTAVGYFYFGYTYSEGNRAGVVVKFSKKGFLFKTYEGELNMGGMNSVPNTAQVNQLWLFSVTDKAIGDKLMKLEGRRVSLHYREIIKNLPWNGDTRYFVDGAEEIK